MVIGLQADIGSMNEIAHEIAAEVWNNYIARPNNDPEKHRFSFKDLEKAINLKLKEDVEKN